MATNVRDLDVNFILKEHVMDEERDIYSMLEEAWNMGYDAGNEVGSTDDYQEGYEVGYENGVGSERG